MSPYSTRVRVMLVPDDPPNPDERYCFCKGVADLLDGVVETGSLNAAAKRIGMAYSKAWSLVRECEAAFDAEFLDRDGAHGSTLTLEGFDLLARYHAAETLAQAAVSRDTEPSSGDAPE